jgi:hypothetical protein
MARPQRVPTEDDREFMDLNRISRKQLIERAKQEYGLSKSTMDKFFQARFSDRTRTLICKITGAPVGGQQNEGTVSAEKMVNIARADLGQYAKGMYQHYVASYRTIMPNYGDPSQLVTYRTEIVWDDALPGLRFAEELPDDIKEVGQIYIPLSSAFLYFITIRQGYVRTVVVSHIVREAIMRGLILCQAKVRGSNWAPVCSPIVYEKQKPGGNDIPYEVISPNHEQYEKYRYLLRQSLTTNVVQIITMLDDLNFADDPRRNR